LAKKWVVRQVYEERGEAEVDSSAEQGKKGKQGLFGRRQPPARGSDTQAQPVSTGRQNRFRTRPYD
jgi:hypothetical protein